VAELRALSVTDTDAIATAIERLLKVQV